MTNNLLVCLVVLTTCFLPCFMDKTLDLLMPNVQPTQPETYLCTSFKMNKKDHEYIVKFQPNATMHVAHHILIYGCKEPGYVERDTPRVVWECGEMAGLKSNYHRAATCGSGSQVIYAWAKDAPALQLPEGVGFKVGKGTDVHHLVLQVHYASVEKFLNGGTDNSGIIITLKPSSDQSVTKRAGVYLLGTSGAIPKKETEYMESACTINEPIVIHPFAFRTHTHALGKAVAGYVKKGNVWTRIGKHDPQQPQMFYPVDDQHLTIKQGDVVAARCTMFNFRNRVTYVGPTGEDEMCNFYMMYFVDGDKILEDKYCFSAGPPHYYWETDPQVGQPPRWVNRDASTIRQLNF